MKIGVLGTGMVGEALGTKLAALGHEVRMGSRDAKNPKALAWAAKAGERASVGTFADAAAFGELLLNCVGGKVALAALESAGKKNIGSKIVIDIANPLDFSKGMPPSLLTSSVESLGEQIQAAFPDARVVKTLNTVTCGVMVDPGSLPEETDMFLCGNDAGAKKEVEQLLREGFGWKRVHDLGDITNARATEHYLPLWVRLYGKLGTANFNMRLVQG